MGNARKAAKEEKKGKVIAKSNIIFDVKPWDDETDMAALEANVRTIEMEGLLWGTGKLVAIGYGIKKLQITCVIVDDLVSTDLLEENDRVRGLCSVCRCRRLQQDLDTFPLCRL